MKKAFFVFIVAFGFTACNSPEKGENGEVYKTPMKYNDYIIERQNKILEKIIKFSNTAESDLDEADQLLNDYAIDASAMLKEIKGMPSYRKDTAFRQAAINTFKFYKQVFEVHYKDIVRFRKENTDEADEQINNVVELLTKEEEKVDKAFHNAQKDFAKKNKMKLIDNQMQKKIDAMD